MILSMMPVPQNSEGRNCQLPMIVDVASSGALKEAMEFHTMPAQGGQIVFAVPTGIKQLLGEQMIGDCSVRERFARDFEEWPILKTSVPQPVIDHMSKGHSFVWPLTQYQVNNLSVKMREQPQKDLEDPIVNGELVDSSDTDDDAELLGEDPLKSGYFTPHQARDASEMP